MNSEARVLKEARWRSVPVNGAKTTIGILGVLDVILFLVVLVIALFAPLPFLPSSLFGYGFIYALPHAVAWLLALGVSGTRSRALVSAATLLYTFVLILDFVPLAGYVVWLVNCILDNPMFFLPACVVASTATLQILMLAFTLVFFIISLVVLFSLVDILRKTSGRSY